MSSDIPDAPVRKTVIDMSEYLDTEQLCQGFARTTQTLYLWRTKKGLPYTEFPIGRKVSIRFNMEDVKEWARARGLKFRQSECLAAKEPSV